MEKGFQNWRPLDIAADVDIVKKSGSWYSYNDTKLGQGRENVKKFLEDNLDLTTEIDEKVRAFYNLNEEHEESGTSVSKEIVEE